ncbi:MAG TPA: SH3 domain-containing protein [Stellaceae bacterium]|nr:SH3 domain-containing protein [Stellaceae bacterium]
MFSSSVDKSDACGVQHRDFADSQNYYLNETAQGAIFGALGGAALGALTAAAVGGNVGQGAAIGAGAGAVTGAYAGYWNAKQKDYKDQTQLTQSIYDDVRKASTEMDRTSTTFAALKQCRYEHAALIKAQYKQGTLTRDQAQAQLADQQKRFKDEVVLARKYGEKMSDQEKNFSVAATNLAADDPDAQQALKTPRRTAAATPTAGGTTLTVVKAANVRSAPDANSTRLGGLSPGDKVASAGAPVNGWRKITYNGQDAYVSEGIFSATPAAAPAPTTAAATPAPAPESSDKKVAVAQNVTETIPEKREHYDKSVDDADKGSSIAFNLDQPSPAG